MLIIEVSSSSELQLDGNGGAANHDKLYCAPQRNYLINSKKGPNGTGSWKLILPRDPTGTGTYPPVLKNQ